MISPDAIHALGLFSSGYPVVVSASEQMAWLCSFWPKAPSFLPSMRHGTLSYLLIPLSSSLCWLLCSFRSFSVVWIGCLFPVSDPQLDLPSRTFSLTGLGSSSGRSRGSWGESALGLHIRECDRGGDAQSRDPWREPSCLRRVRAQTGREHPCPCHPNAAVQTLQHVAVFLRLELPPSGRAGSSKRKAYL